MRCFPVLACFTLLCGCIGGGGSTIDESTTTSYKTEPKITEYELSLARNHVTKMDSYLEDNCRQMTLEKTNSLDCPSCWNITYAYTCNVMGELTSSEKRVATVTLRDKNVTDYHMVRSEKSCVFDADCLPKNPAANMRYVCVDGLCETEIFKDEASIYCMSEGNHVLMRRQTSGKTYLVCVFPNGNECELVSYYRGRCDSSSSNISDCTGYKSGQICTLEYNPVCAIVESTAGGEKDVFLKTFSNACLACSSGTKTEATKGYLMGTCPTTTTTTVKPVDVDNAAKKYCEDKGYVYKMRSYPGGERYGVCIFGIESECNAIEYFHGRCNPKASI